MDFTRRHFMRTGTLAALGTAISPQSFAFSEKYTYRPICVFSKCLHFLDYDSLAEVVSSIGFDGVDLSVRPEGHVLPDNVSKDLPLAVKILQKSGIKVPMIVTSILDPGNKQTDRILASASDLGIERYRMGWFNYDLSKSVLQNLDNYKRVMENFEKINRRYKIRGEYQNHSGPYNRVGGPVWDLYMLLKDLDPEFIGIQYDVMHATAEGTDTWIYGYDLLKPWIGSLDIKDFRWIDGKVKYVSLGSGVVNYDLFLKEVKKLKSNEPISIHFEYDLGGAEHGSRKPSMPAAEIYGSLKKDLLFFKNRLYN